MRRRARVFVPPAVQVLSSSLEARVMLADNSALAKDCRKEIKAINARLLKLGRKVHRRDPMYGYRIGSRFPIVPFK
jgi:hypothetical protein